MKKILSFLIVIVTIQHIAPMQSNNQNNPYENKRSKLEQFFTAGQYLSDYTYTPQHSRSTLFIGFSLAAGLMGGR